MGNFTNEITAEIQMQYDLKGDVFQRVNPSKINPEHKYYVMRQYVFWRLDKTKFTFDEICKKTNIQEHIFVNWQLDWLEIDLFSITKLEMFLDEKLIMVK